MVRAAALVKKPDFTLPSVALSRLEKFLLDGATGNVTWNVRDGKILGVTFTEQVKIAE